MLFFLVLFLIPIIASIDAWQHNAIDDNSCNTGTVPICTAASRSAILNSIGISGISFGHAVPFGDLRNVDGVRSINTIL